MAFELSPEIIRNMVKAIEVQPLPNRIELADVFGVTERTILSWTDEGMPAVLVNQKGKENQYPMIDCVIWLLTREFDRLTRETQRDRLDRIRADREELSLAKDIGMLAPADDFETTWARNVMACRSELLNLGPRLASKLTALLNVEVAEEPITEEVERALTKLASAGVDIEDEIEDEELVDESESSD